MASVSGTSSESSGSANRLTGLSGLDTESMVKQLMDAEQVPLDKLKQKRDLATWRMEAYRELTTKFTTFKSDYMNVLNSASNMLSKSTYKAFKAALTDSVTGESSSAVSISTNAETSLTNHTIKVSNLATAAKAESTATVSKAIQGSAAITDFNLTGKKLKVTLDGISKTIDLGNYTGGMSELITDLNTKLTNAFGKGKDGLTGKIQVSETTAGSKILNLTTGNGASVLSVSTTDVTSSDGLAGLKLTSGQSNRISVSAKLGDLTTLNSLTFGGTDSDELKFSINNASFTFDKDTKLSDMMAEINSNVDANVTMKYDEVNDKFTIEAKTTGAGANIKIAQTAGNFFGTVSNIASGDYANGEDARVTIDDQEIVRNSNSFTVNNIKYTLNATTTNDLKVGLSVDTDKVVSNIKGFIDKYNELISTVTKKVDEDYDKDYPPLTDKQKEAMSDDEITKWESKAKTGLLENDSTLQSMVTKMRTAMVDIISGVTGSLSSIGISSNSYEDKGKLSIDEKKLREAIESDPDKVANLFAKKSEDEPNYSRTLKSGERQTRYNQEGIVNRLYDIIEDNFSTYRDSNGNKGVLVEKAGIVGDTSEVTNTIAKQIIDYEEQIDNMVDKLADKEDAYYRKFSALETALQKMNSQSSYITSMLGGASQG